MDNSPERALLSYHLWSEARNTFARILGCAFGATAHTRRQLMVAFRESTRETVGLLLWPCHSSRSDLQSHQNHYLWSTTILPQRMLRSIREVVVLDIIDFRPVLFSRRVEPINRVLKP